MSSEVARWLYFWQTTEEKMPTSAAETTEVQLAMIKIVCIMSVTSCECERSNSGLGLVKTFLRATMGQGHFEWATFGACTLQHNP